MVSDEFLYRATQVALYQHKESTKDQYYWQSGSRILSNRLSITEGDVTKVTNKGRMLTNKSVGQCLGRFTQQEQSPLKVNKPFTVRTQIFRRVDYPQFFGYGTCGISGQDGKVVDTGDLLIFYTSNNRRTFTIFFMRGMAKDPDLINTAFKYATNKIKQL